MLNHKFHETLVTFTHSEDYKKKLAKPLEKDIWLSKLLMSLKPFLSAFHGLEAH